MRKLVAWGILLVAIPVLLLASLTNLVDDAINFFTGIPGDIKRFVQGAINAALDVLKGPIDWLSDNVRNLWDHITGVADGLTHFVNDVYNGAVRYAREGLDWLRDSLIRYVDDVRHWAGNAIDWVGRRIEDIYGWAQAALAEMGRFINDNVLQPLWHGLQDLTAWVNDHVFQPLWHFANDIWQHLLDGFKSIFGTLGDILKWLWDVGYKIADLVLHAAEWLAFFALHTFSWFHDLFTEMVQQGPKSIIEAVTGSMVKEGGHLEDLITRWLGE
jgi:phage-related protein